MFFQITCSKYVDWSRRNVCITYDLSSCATPEIPPSCPILDQRMRYPCTRYRCSKLNESGGVSETNLSTATKLQNPVDEASDSGNCYFSSPLNLS